MIFYTIEIDVKLKDCVKSMYNSTVFNFCNIEGQCQRYTMSEYQK